MKSEIILVLLAVILSGCSQNSTTETVKTVDVNQNASQNINQAATTLNNNAAANPPNTATTTTVNNTSSPANNTSVPTVGTDKKPSVAAMNEPKPQIGSGGNDMFLLMQARGAFGSDEELLNHVIVDIKEGNAVLTGSVSSEAQKAKAGRLVQAIKGLKSVKNNLSVSR